MSNMPAAAPTLADHLGPRLQALGAGIRAQRKRHRISAATAAESAGMSRATLHRIEAGEPSVTMGAYVSAMDALGLRLDIAEPPSASAPAGRTGHDHEIPQRIRIDDYPQLRRIAWQRRGGDITPAEALSLYERNWRHVDTAALDSHERAFVDRLVAKLGKGHLLV